MGLCRLWDSDKPLRIVRRRVAMIEFRILGPLEVVEGDRWSQVGSTKERALLALVVLDAGQVVPIDRLVEGLWGEQASLSAVNTVRTYVSHLRHALEDSGDAALIETADGGYRLTVEPDQIDAHRFALLVQEGSRVYGEGSPQTGREEYLPKLRPGRASSWVRARWTSPWRTA